MLNENIEIIKNTFLNYYADQKYFIIYLIALLFIFINEKQKMNKNFLVYYPLIVFIIVLNPMFAFFILKIIQANVYCRFFWTIPFGVGIAYFGVQLIEKVNEKFKKGVVVVAFILIIIYSGTFMYTNPNFTPNMQVNNWYKIPDEYVQVTQIIGKVPLKNKKAMTSVDMIGYIRQLDASIKLAYGRNVFENYEDNYYVVKCYNAGDVKCLIDVCLEEETNIIIYDNAIPLTISPAHYGYNLYAQTEHYDIYVLEEEIS